MDIEQLEEFDGFAGLRHKLASIEEDHDQWAGIPMPLTDLPLVIHPKYPLAKELMAIGQKSEDEDPSVIGPPDNSVPRLRNQFWSARYRTTVGVFEHRGKIRHCYLHPANQVDQLVQTIGASHAWGIAQEGRALQLLGTLVRHHTFKHYLLTGTFLEQSPRSKVTYMFRKLRPTIAMNEQQGRMHILAALCGHPIAHYEGSWGGAMCPTDDVIAALVLMRGDEHAFWRRYNQHHPSRPQAGM